MYIINITINKENVFFFLSFFIVIFIKFCNNCYIYSLYALHIISNIKMSNECSILVCQNFMGRIDGGRKSRAIRSVPESEIKRKRGIFLNISYAEPSVFIAHQHDIYRATRESGQIVEFRSTHTVTMRDSLRSYCSSIINSLASIIPQ